MNSPHLITQASSNHYNALAAANSNSNNNNNNAKNNLMSAMRTLPPTPSDSAAAQQHQQQQQQQQQQANKFAPARRLAARQTLRLAIPKQQGDSLHLQNACNAQSNNTAPPATATAATNAAQQAALFRHAGGPSPSQLPPAPILKRSAKTASPLETHNLANMSAAQVTPHTAGCLSAHSNGNGLGYHHNGGHHGNNSTNKYLGIRKPSITLNSADIRNNNDLFAFAKDLTPPTADIGERHSPIFADLTASISPGTSSASPTHHLSRLFNLSPPTLRSYGNMSDFADSSQNGVISPATSLIENFHKKTGTPTSSNSNCNSLIGGATSTSGATTSPSLNGNSGPLLTHNGNGSGSIVGSCNSITGRQINTSSCSSVKETSSTSQQVVNSSNTTTRVEKKSQRLHHITSSSSSSSSSTSSAEMKTEKLKRNLDDIKNSMSEINDLAMGRPTVTTATPTANNASSESAFDKMKRKLRSSIEDLVDRDEPLVTFPDDDDNPDLHDCLELVNSTANLAENGLSGSGIISDTVKFEEKRTKTESKTKVVKDGFSSEQATSNLAETKRLQAGDIDYQEAKAQAAMRNRLEVDGYKTEENAAMIKEALSLRTGDITQQASNNVAAASIKVQSDNFSADKKSISQSQQSQTLTSNGVISQEKHVSSASQSNYTMTHKGVSSSGSSMISSSSQMSATNGALIKLSDLKLDDLDALSSGSGTRAIEQAITKYSQVLTSFVSSLQDTKAPTPEKSIFLDKINEVIRRAWAVPTHGHHLGYSLCSSLRKSGGLDLLMKNCVQNDMKIKFSSAKLLEQCLTTENREHVVHNGLDKVVNVACVCTRDTNTEHSRVGTGILEHLFKHSEGTCSDVIKLGGLDAVLYECRTNDVETLRHCASALANLSLYGGAENQEAMINRKVPMWLFPLAFHDDDNIKYYACLAIAVLVANKEIEAEVLKSGCLDLVEPFVTSRDPSKFAKSNLAHAHGQSETWLKRLVPVLSSNREEARNLAAFHFCMEAGIKREQGQTQIFGQIGAIEALKTVASCPNAIASKFAAQALRLIGEEVPHKLSQQVPLWSVEDVKEWVKQIGFIESVGKFEKSRVDGDLLLKLKEDNLRNDIDLADGILLMRFERELQNLKRMADYSSKDPTKINQFLAEIGPEYCTYTYSMLHAGIDRSSLPTLNEDMLIAECGIKNSIHRLRILNAVKNLENSLPSTSEENMAKTLDVFVSYRRSNGSQLASLLKVHLQLRGFSVFIDVERLEAGKFDNGLLNSIRQAKNFVLVLTPNALERCVDDDEGKDWVHREIVAALNSNCNIIPIIDQKFDWPLPEQLPEDMRSVCHFNGVTWIHDYQDACIDKLERFMRGEKNVDRITQMSPGTTGPATVTYQRMHSNDSDYQNAIGNGGGSGVVVGSNSSAVGTTNGGGQANHQANRYRQSSSPGRQRLGGIGTGGSGVLGSLRAGSQFSILGRGSKRSIIQPYRTQQAPHKVMPICGSLQNVSPSMSRPPRRSSAVGICTDNKTTSNYRSHSVDGLLDSNQDSEQRIAEAAAMVTADSTALTNASSTRTLQPGDDYMSSINSLTGSEMHDEDSVPKREKVTNLPPINPQHRKSRSLDHFLDEQTLAAMVVPPEPTDGTQSMQNLAMPMTPEPQRGTRLTTTLPQRASSARESKSATPDRTTAVTGGGGGNGPSMPSGRHGNAVTRQSPEGISSTEDEREDTQSVYSVATLNGKRTSSCSLPPAPKSQTRAPAHLHRGSQSHTSNHNHNNNSSSSNKASSSSLGSSNSNANGRTIFNRTMKKVRSLIKNNDIENEELPGLILSKATVPTAGRIIFW